MKPIKRNILLNPGPATTTDTVKYAQVVPDICPREAEFGQTMEFVSTELTRLVADLNDYSAVLFGGSGTSAVESIISSVVKEKAILIVQNGAYGKRMCEIANVYDLNFLEFNSVPDDGIDLTALETFIQSVPQQISHLAVVHNETTTGLLNDIEVVGKLCKKYQIDLIVDAMSSFAAVPIDMKKMNISYLAASSNKNIQGMAGIAFVIAPTDKLKSLSQKSRNYYLNLYAQYEYFTKTRQMRFTPPVQTIYALKQALIELHQEGVEKRYARYTKSWKTLIDGIKYLGLKLIVPEKHHSKIVTAIQEPDYKGYNFHEMHDYLYNQGFTIYPGKLENAQTFRVANIGAVSYKDMEKFLSFMEQYLSKVQSKLKKVDTK